MAGRPRRTRVYDCSYNIGEKYYKPALDNLDRKYSGRSGSIDRIFSARPKLNVDNLLDEDMLTARRRAEKAITEDTFFDSRGARIPKNTFSNSAFDDEIDEEVQSSLNRIRANKKFSALTTKDNEIEDQIQTVKRRARIDLGDKLLDAAGNDELGGTIRTRALKMVTRAQDDYVDKSNLTKWTAIEDSAATQRAKATKARLNDLENEMYERSEKQLAREKRSAHLKKFLADSDIDTSLVRAEKHDF